MKSRSILRNATTRAGAATVEFAVCLPLMMLIVLGLTEFGNFIFLQQGIVAATQAAARQCASAKSSAAALSTINSNIRNEMLKDTLPTIYSDTSKCKIEIEYQATGTSSWTTVSTAVDEIKNDDGSNFNGPIRVTISCKYTDASSIPCFLPYLKNLTMSDATVMMREG